MAEDATMIDSGAAATGPIGQQRLLDVGDEPWNDFYEMINSLMLEEKKCRQENDTFKGSELCCKIVSLSHFIFTEILVNSYANDGCTLLYSFKLPMTRETS